MNRSIAAADRCQLKRLRPLMGTFVAIEATHINGDQAAAAVDAAYAAIAQLEVSLHPDRPVSDLVKIRDARCAARVAVGASTLEVLRIARELWEKSQGVFDPCLPDAPGLMEDLTIDTHVSARKPVHIDLGGIAKGYAVDVAIEILMSRGCDSGLVNAGGDVRVFGDAPTEIVVRCRDQERTSVLLNGSIAVSDTTALFKPSEHRGYYRRCGHGDLVARGAIVSATRAVIADALTKCVLLSDATALLREFDAKSEVW